MKSYFSLKFASVSLAISLQIAVISAFPKTLQAQLKNTSLSQKVAAYGEVIGTKIRFKPPKVGAPKNRSGGASRGGNCSLEQKSLKALLPASKLGLTVAEYPTFFVYVPQSSTQLAEFELREENNNKIVYKKRLMVPATAGIVNFSLSDNKTLLPLKIGKNYHWFFSIICDPQDRSEDLFIEGWIQRIEPSPTLVRQLHEAAPRDRPRIYAAAGIWHETLATLMDLRSSYPNDLTLVVEWAELLESVGLSKIAKEPLVQCCHKPLN
ncbi:hypothetical protein BZZ01_03425 [Nostocales cyanobacterium HT-58-2]|nr:hypothetical protein BZZ01_03425 [Nostocales cyanobacterium HT-58-2]